MEKNGKRIKFLEDYVNSLKYNKVVKEEIKKNLEKLIREDEVRFLACLILDLFYRNEFKFIFLKKQKIKDFKEWLMNLDEEYLKIFLKNIFFKIKYKKL